MRRVFVLLVVLVGAAILATPSYAAKKTSVRCPKAKGVDIYFWPTGHGVVKDAGFPAFEIPHLEVYRKGPVLRKDAEARAYLDAGQHSVSPKCKQPAKAVPAGKWRVKPKAMRATVNKLRCSFGRRMAIRMRIVLKPVAGSNQVFITRGTTNRRLVQARIGGAAGSVLKYDRKFCKVV